MNKKNKNIHNPFSSLKGFSVSEPEKKRSGKTKETKGMLDTKQRLASTPPREQKTMSEAEENRLFFEEMNTMGLTEKRPSPANKSKPQPESEKVSEEDTTLFLSAISEMGPTFNEAIPEKIIEKHATARFEKLLRQKKINPEVKLDLHGQYADEAIRSTLIFLQQARQQGVTSAIIVTGKGYGSKDGPVLKPAIERLLKTDASKHVIEWCQAPIHLGGSGALVVFLRKLAAKE